MLGRVEAKQDAGLFLDYTNQQVIDVLLQLHDLVVLLGEFRLLLDHQCDQLLLGQLSIRPTSCRSSHLMEEALGITHGHQFYCPTYCTL